MNSGDPYADGPGITRGVDRGSNEPRSPGPDRAPIGGSNDGGVGAQPVRLTKRDARPVLVLPSVSRARRPPPRRVAELAGARTSPGKSAPATAASGSLVREPAKRARGLVREQVGENSLCRARDRRLRSGVRRVVTRRSGLSRGSRRPARAESASGRPPGCSASNASYMPVSSIARARAEKGGRGLWSTIMCNAAWSTESPPTGRSIC